jgi:hypothetical protein
LEHREPALKGRLAGSTSSGVPKTFPPPWAVEEQDAYFLVRNHNGQQLAYIYFRD